MTTIMRYTEDDWEALVEVVHDNSTADEERYTLKVVENLKNSNVFREVEVGTVFDVSKARKYADSPYCWQMEDCKT
jgi:hypothetical protein